MAQPQKFRGVTFIEVIVSAAVFTIAFAGIYFTLINNTRVDAVNQQVALALNTITTQANTDGTTPFASLAVGVTPITLTTLPGGVLTRTVTLTTSNTIKTINYSVTWTGHTQPVQADYELVEEGLMND